MKLRVRIVGGLLLAGFLCVAEDSTERELKVWEATVKSGRAADYQAYLEKYPRGIYAELAGLRLEAAGKCLASKSPDVAGSVWTLHFEDFGRESRNSRDSTVLYLDAGGSYSYKNRRIPKGTWTLAAQDTVVLDRPESKKFCGEHVEAKLACMHMEGTRRAFGAKCDGTTNDRWTAVRLH
jgi:hypothetical protein